MENIIEFGPDNITVTNSEGTFKRVLFISKNDFDKNQLEALTKIWNNLTSNPTIKRSIITIDSKGDIIDRPKCEYPTSSATEQPCGSEKDLMKVRYTTGSKTICIDHLRDAWKGDVTDASPIDLSKKA